MLFIETQRQAIDTSRKEQQFIYHSPLQSRDKGNPVAHLLYDADPTCMKVISFAIDQCLQARQTLLGLENLIGMERPQLISMLFCQRLEIGQQFCRVQGIAIAHAAPCSSSTV
jgi:hypothetical protein